jgi:transposase-like protein
VAKGGRPAGRKRWSEEDRQRALEIYKSSGPREAARQIGCNAGTVTRWAKAAGLSATDRIEKLQAANATVRELTARRFERLKGRLLEEAETALDELHSKTMSLKWHEGELLQQEIPEPTFTDKRHIMFRANGAVQYALQIDQRTSDDSETNAAIGQWAKAMTAEAERRNT